MALFPRKVFFIAAPTVICAGALSLSACQSGDDRGFPDGGVADGSTDAARDADSDAATDAPHADAADAPVDTGPDADADAASD